MARFRHDIPRTGIRISGRRTHLLGGITRFIAIPIIACTAFWGCSRVNSEKLARALENRDDFTKVKEACISLTGIPSTGEVILSSSDHRVPPLLRSLAPYTYPIEVRSNAVTLRIKDAWGPDYGFGFEVHQIDIIDWDIRFYYKGLFSSDFELDERRHPVKTAQSSGG